MKHLFYLLAAVLLLSCQKDRSITLSGQLSPFDKKYVKELEFSGADTSFLVPVDSTGHFTLKAAGLEYPYLLMQGVVFEKQKTKGLGRWPIVTPVYLPAGEEVKMDIEMADRNFSISTDEPGNKAIQAYRKKQLETMPGSLRKDPSIGNIRKTVDDLQQLVDDAVRNGGLDRQAGVFLQEMAALDKTSYLENAVKFYKEKGLEGNPLESYTDLPDLLTLFDKPYWEAFPHQADKITRYIVRHAQTPEERMALLHERFKTPSIHREQAIRLVTMFVNTVRYSDENFDRLEKLCSQVPGKESEKALEIYASKKYAVTGAPCPDVTFRDKDGKAHRLDEFKGRYVFVDMWASWCGPCCKEVPHMQQLEKAFRNNRDIVFVSISLDENRTHWLDKMEMLKMHGNQWMVEDSTFPVMMNVKGIPHFLLYDREGKLMVYSAPRPSNPEAARLLGSLE